MQLSPLLAFARSYVPSHPVSVFAADLISALRIQPTIDARMLGNRAELARWASIWAALGAVDRGEDRSTLREVPLQAVRDVFRSVVGHRTVVRAPDAQLARFWSDYTNRDRPAVKAQTEPPLAPSIDQTIDNVLSAV